MSHSTHRVQRDVGPAFLDGGGELGALIRAQDWSCTPLGDTSSWPQSLKTAVQIMLTSRQPFWLGWGPELTYLYNDPYKSIIGGKHPWALGRAFSEVWSEIWDIVGPLANTVMNDGQGIYLEAQLLIMERHGYQEETYYTFSYSPVLDDRGKPGGLICANTDDTRRVIGERQLATLNALAAGTADAATAQDACTLAIEALRTNGRDLPFALIYTDTSGAGTASVAAASHGDPAFHEALRALCEQLMRAGTAGVMPLDALRCAVPSGAWTKAPAGAAILPITDSSGVGRAGALVVGLNPYRQYDDGYSSFLALIARQIAAAIAKAEAYESERKRAEALAELDRAKTTFFSNVSHEFRTPLTLMLSPLGDLASTQSHSHEVRSTASLALRNGERLLKLVNTLLDFSRIEAGRTDAIYEPVDLPRMTEDLASTFRSAIEKAGMTLEIASKPLPHSVYVDRDMWEKIVLNLVSNAFKYTLDGGVAVSVRDDAGEALLEVRDTGYGIPQEELPRIFERFHRVAESQGRSVEGTGIGLALVNELVKLHGGRVSVDSVLAEGSIFRVHIPYGSAHLPPERVGATRQLASTAMGAAPYVQEAERWLVQAANSETSSDAVRRPRGTILLADDNADMRDYVKRLLAPDYDVIAVSDGREALKVLAGREVELVLTDVMMPKVDGFELLRVIRSNPRHADTPVVMLSARAGEEARVEGLDAGADDYLVKPFSARELLARVDGQIASRQLRAESLKRERDLRTEAEILNEIARELAAELDLQALLQKVTDIAARASAAQFGAFFYNHVDDRGDSYMLYTLSGARSEDFSELGMPRNTPMFAATFGGEGVVRLDDVCEDPRYGKNAPHRGMPEGHLPVRSYLAAPVVSRTGEVIGGLFFGHSERAVFTARAERLVTSIAAQAAIAIDNARLYRAAQQELAAHERTERELAAIKDDLALQVSGLTRVHELVLQLATLSDLDSMLNEVLRAAADIHGTQRGLLSLYEPEQAMLVVRASLGFDDTNLSRVCAVEPGPSAGACGTAFFSKERVVVEDTETDLRFDAFRADARRVGFRAVHSVPIFKRGGEILGILSVHFDAPHAPTHLQVQLAEMCARHAADAIEGARGEAALRGDIEKRRAAEAALQEADRRKDEFIATLAHELRNPLAPIANGLEILHRGGNDPQVLGTVHAVMDRQFKHMVRLVDDLLDLSRVSRGRIELRKERIDLADAMRAAIETSGPLIEAAGLRLTTRIPLEPLHVEADLTRIAQVVANLLNNAAKYGGPPGEEIVLSAERAGDNVVVRVTDRGIGIPADALPKIFEMFTQVDGSLERSRGGLGIGLTLVRRLTELHGGTVQAMSDGPGKGSEFVVRLPAVPPRARRDEPDPDETAAILPGPCCSKILIADDNVDAARSLGTLLELSGHTVKVVHDGPQALAAAAELRPDVILLDIGMPLMNGYDVCRAIREQPWAEHMPIVAITGWGQEEDRRRAVEAGFTHHITKPVNLAQLERLIRA